MKAEKRTQEKTRKRVHQKNLFHETTSRFRRSFIAVNSAAAAAADDDETNNNNNENSEDDAKQELQEKPDLAAYTISYGYMNI